MKYKIDLKWLFCFISLMIITACSGDRKNIEDALNRDIIGDDFSILHTVDIVDGYITFFERNIFKDISVAIINKSKDESKTSYGGYLSQSAGEPSSHYTSAEIAGKAYSIYFGRLDERSIDKKVFVELGDQLRKEAKLFEASSGIVWFVFFDERIESSEITIIIGDEKSTLTAKKQH